MFCLSVGRLGTGRAMRNLPCLEDRLPWSSPSCPSRLCRGGGGVLSAQGVISRSGCFVCVSSVAIWLKLSSCPFVAAAASQLRGPPTALLLRLNCLCPQRSFSLDRLGGVAWPRPPPSAVFSTSLGLIAGAVQTCVGFIHTSEHLKKYASAETHGLQYIHILIY